MTFPIRNRQDQLSKANLIVNNKYFWSILWFVFVAYYAISLKYNYYTEIADYVAYIVQVIADIFMAVFSVLAYIKSTDKESKIFYLFILVSILPGLVSTETYNLLVSLIKIKSFDTKLNQSWIFSYTFFLVIQICAWSYLLTIKKSEKKSEKSTWISLFPYIQAAMVALLLLFLVCTFRDIVFKNMNFPQALNTFLEVILFVLISDCLSKTKNKSLIYIEMGFLFLIAFNLAHRFSYMTGHYYKSFDMVWLISYIIIISGFSLAVNQKDEKIEFLERNSIHVLISAIFTMFATFLFLLFLLLGFIISSIETNNIGALSIFPESIPSTLVFSFSLSVLIGKLVAEHFSRPLERISKRIDIIYGSKLDGVKIPDEKFEINEIEKLDKFIMSTISDLQIANRAKSEFLMSMSHDFRTPASGIYHMSRAIYRRIEDPELKRLQKLIVDSSEQLMSFLEDILDYSRLDSDKYESNVRIIAIEPIINEVVSFVSAKAKEKMLTINTQFSESSINFAGDRHMMRRIMLNIVSNAIKFTHAGEVTISTSKEKIDGAKWLVIKIKDTGIGIDKCHHKMIFEPFTRVASAETAKYAGIGLGLSNVNLMLSKMGGKILLESNLNQGSLFIVQVPI